MSKLDAKFAGEFYEKRDGRPCRIRRWEEVTPIDPTQYDEKISAIQQKANEDIARLQDEQATVNAIK